MKQDKIILTVFLALSLLLTGCTFKALADAPKAKDLGMMVRV